MIGYLSFSIPVSEEMTDRKLFFNVHHIDFHWKVKPNEAQKLNKADPETK